MLDKLTLGMLLYKDLTIYDIKKAFDEGINQFYSTSYGAIHPALKKLSAKGFVDMCAFVENGRSKKRYALNPEGKAHFIEWLMADISLSKVNEEGVLRVFFFKEIPKEERLKKLHKYIADMTERLDILQAVKKMHDGADIPAAHKEAFNYRVTTIDFGLGYYAFAIDWYRSLIRRIESGEMEQ